MTFLRKRDYFTEIREEDLDVILKQAAQTTSFTPDKVLDENARNTQEMVEAMISHRYDVRKIFKDILTYNLTDTFQIGDLVEYSEPDYVSTDTFVEDDRVSFEQTVGEVLLDDIFEANQAVAAGETPATDPDKWDKITENFSLYFVEQPTTGVLPDVSFAFTLNNFTGNHDTILGWDKTKTIFLKRIEASIKIYYSDADRTADQNSIGIVKFDPLFLDELDRFGHRNHDHHEHEHATNHHGPLSEVSVREFPANIPILPGEDRENKLTGDLSIIGFTPKDQEWDVAPSNAFIKGDNRSRLIKKALINIAIFEIHKLINPRNIPDLRGEAKDDQMDILKDIKRGRITPPDLPIFFDEEKGQEITFNSHRKLNHNY